MTEERGDGSLQASGLAARMAEHKKEATRLERVLRDLSERWSDPRAVEKDLDGLAEHALERALELSAGIRELVERGKTWLASEKEERRSRLARGLKEGAAARQVPLLVVTREPLELRLPPLGVAIDIEEARATITFGQQELAACPADAEEILEAREKALSQLDRSGWDPEVFHRDLRQAWLAAVARTGQGEGWVELAEVLPQLAFALQSPRWRLDPSPRNFTGYGKAQFLYELNRLRSAGGLSCDGWRLVLGPATGASTRDKRRVFWVEDGEGRGAYHLTLRFARDEELHGPKS